ncbi:MAG: TRAP transporter substrate-binding protein DctP [Spirochaetia bacterium]
MLLQVTCLPVILVFFLFSSEAFAAGETEPSTTKSETTRKTLTLATYQSYGNPLVSTFSESLEKFSKNRLDVDVYHGETLLKKAELLSGISSGIVDMGAINPTFYPETLSLHAKMPAFSRVPRSITGRIEAIRRIYERYPEMIQEIEEFDQTVLFQSFPLPMAIISSVPVEDIEDVKGLRIRAASRAHIRILRSLGAHPVSLPLEDSYIALQTGTIDGMFTTIDRINSLSLYEHASYSFTSPEMAFCIPLSYTIHNTTWNDLDKDSKTAIQRASSEATKEMSQVYENSFQDHIRQQEEYGVEVTIADKEDLAQWHALPVFSNMRTEFAAEAEAKGIESGQKMVEEIKHILSRE